jgi:phage associated membrane protein
MTDSLIQIATPILTVIGVFVAAYGIMRNTENAKKCASTFYEKPDSSGFFY